MCIKRWHDIHILEENAIPGKRLSFTLCDMDIGDSIMINLNASMVPGDEIWNMPQV